MSTIRVTFVYDAEPDERDAADESGLTEPAYMELLDGLGNLGAVDVEVTQVPE